MRKRALDTCIYCRGFGYSADTYEAMTMNDVAKGGATVSCPFCGASPRPSPEYYESLPQRDEERGVLKTVVATDTQEAEDVSTNQYSIDAKTQRYLNWFFIIAIAVLALLYLTAPEGIKHYVGGSGHSSASTTTTNPVIRNQPVEGLPGQSQDLYQMQQQIKCLQWNQSHQNDGWPAMDCTP